MIRPSGQRLRESLTSRSVGRWSPDTRFTKGIKEQNFCHLKMEIFLKTSSHADQSDQSECLFWSVYEEVGRSSIKYLLRGGHSTHCHAVVLLRVFLSFGACNLWHHTFAHPGGRVKQSKKSLAPAYQIPSSLLLARASFQNKWQPWAGIYFTPLITAGGQGVIMDLKQESNQDKAVDVLLMTISRVKWHVFPLERLPVTVHINIALLLWLWSVSVCLFSKQPLPWENFLLKP